MKAINICVYSGLHILVLFFLVGCTPPNTDKKNHSLSPEPFVSTMVIKPKHLNVFEELPGRVMAVRIAEIRPQVGGIVQQRFFKQGSKVNAGQPLFQIDPAPFKAEVDTARAYLQKTQVTLKRYLDKEARLKLLVKSDSISHQEYEDVVSLRDQAAAEVAQAQATLARRLLDLKFAKVEAPISGLIEQSLVTEGALVSSTDSTPMARIQQIDQVFVDVRQPAASLETLRETLSTHTNNANETKIDILRSNGEPYSVKGTMLFSGINVDPSTGDVLLRLLVDNTPHVLLPGMFVKARILHSSYPHALTVPQQAIVRLAGHPHLWTIDPDNRAHLQPVNLGALIDGHYHIKSGITPGEKIVVEGKERLQDGVTVHQRKWKESEALFTSNTK